MSAFFGTLRFRMIPTMYSELGEWMSLYGRGREYNGFKSYTSAIACLLPRRHLLFSGTTREFAQVGPQTPSPIEAYVDQPACGDIVRFWRMAIDPHLDWGVWSADAQIVKSEQQFRWHSKSPTDNDKTSDRCACCAESYSDCQPSQCCIGPSGRRRHSSPSATYARLHS